MGFKIYLYRALRNIIILMVFLPVIDIIVQLISEMEISFSTWLDRLPYLFIVPVLVGFAMPVIIPYRSLTIKIEGDQDRFVAAMIDLPQMINYQLKKKKFGLYVYRFVSGYSLYFYMYFDRLYMKIQTDQIEFNGISTVIDNLDKEFKRQNFNV